MNLSQNLRIALRALTANKLRSALTMLGIVIGVASVVALLSIGTGAQAAITSQIQGIGSNLITIFAGQIGGGADLGGAPARLTLKDAQQLNRLEGVAAVAPQYRTSLRVTRQNNQDNVPVIGVVPDYAKVHLDLVDRGRFISAGDENGQTRVAVLGSQTAKNLFGGADPIGQSVKINGVLFRVIGIRKSQGSGFGQNQDRVVYVPLATAYVKLVGSQATAGGDRIVTSIEVSARDEASVDTAINRITQALRRSHRLQPGEDDDFTALSQSTLLSTANQITGILTVFLGSIAAVSLLVGGIGIMNIMLVSVTERTKEIGLRKAVGARRRDILYQFLVETITLAILGGTIGILAGAGLALLVNATGLITTVISLESVLLAFGFAAAVGLFFGLYPAGRAASLKPIEALRYE